MKIFNVEFDTTGIRATFNLECTDEQAVELRRKVTYELPIYAIYCVQYIDNDTIFESSTLALLLGLLTIDNSQLIDEDKQIEIEVVITAPPNRDIPIDTDILNKSILYPMKKHAPESTNDNYKIVVTNYSYLGVLRAGGLLRCRLFLRRSIGFIHTKWQPVSIFTGVREDNSVKFSVETAGQLSIKKLVEIIEGMVELF